MNVFQNLFACSVLTVAMLAVGAGGWAKAKDQEAKTLPDPGEALPHLRVLTYNIHHGAGNDACDPRPAGSAPAAECSLNLERIAEIIRSSNADIVGLQEVDRYWPRSGGVDQPRVLAKQLGMFVCFGPNLRLPAEGGSRLPREYGTLLLSRYLINNCQNTPLPRVDTANEQRGVLAAEVQTPDGAVRVMVTHLSVVAADRVPQMEFLARAVSHSPLPTILVGDLNAKPEESSFRPLLARLRDIWPMSGKGEGLTSPAHPQRPARSRIDYILVSPGTAVGSVEVLNSETVRMASDHYPVLARIGKGAAVSRSAGASQR